MKLCSVVICPLVPNRILRNLMKLGTKHMEPKLVHVYTLRRTLTSSINGFVGRLCKKYDSSEQEFVIWKREVIRVSDNRIAFYKNANPGYLKL